MPVLKERHLGLPWWSGESFSLLTPTECRVVPWADSSTVWEMGKGEE